jgi:hypothetical protein
MSASVVVRRSSAAAVFLGLRISARKSDHLQTLPGEIIGDRVRWLDKLIPYNLYRAKVDKRKPG